MRFGAVPVGEAAGAILAHTLRVPTAVLKKGRVLSRDDVQTLQTSGHESVTVAQLDPNDVPEDEAAATIARAVAGHGARLAAPFTGRCNIYANERGLALVDRDRIAALNAVGEAATIATVSPHALVARGEMIATVKILPFGVSRAVVDACVAGGGDSLAVAPLRRRHIGFVLTRLPGGKETVLDRAADNMRVRAAHLGSIVSAERRCAHRVDAVAAAIAELRGEGCSPIMILGASAIVDRDDVVPEAIRADGGDIECFGMPVDPGNLVLLGQRDDLVILGVPGCARSLKPSGFDWILRRICAGVTPTRADIAGMGVGGLLADIASRPQPRRATSAGRRPPRVAAVVLAAGQSRRMGPTNKLVEDVDGVPMVARAVDAIVQSRADPVVVVTGFEADRVRAALADRPLTFVDNPDYAAGMSSSLRVGVGALPDDVDAALICLGDMPWIRPTHSNALIDAFDATESREICVPVHEGKRGNPVLFSARFFPEMTGLRGDVGARALIADNPDVVCQIEVADTGVLVDIDTVEALATLAPLGDAD